MTRKSFFLSLLGSLGLPLAAKSILPTNKKLQFCFFYKYENGFLFWDYLDYNKHPLNSKVYSDIMKKYGNMISVEGDTTRECGDKIFRIYQSGFLTQDFSKVLAK